MRILVNERALDVPEGTTALGLRDSRKPDADVVILNGHPVGADARLAPGDAVVLIRRGEVPDSAELESLLVARHSPGVHAKLKRSTVGVAGLGGLGSTVAVSLTRVGIGRLIVADHDVVEPSNLNRQCYFIDQIGRPKVDALAETLRRIHPYVRLDARCVRLDEENIPSVFHGADVIVEALDRAEAKAMLIETVLERMPGVPLVAASGVAGYGNGESIHVHRSGDLYICGDEKTDAAPGVGLMAPRVGLVAQMQANLVMEILLGAEGRQAGASR